jgi:hypothetical protein
VCSALTQTCESVSGTVDASVVAPDAGPCMPSREFCGDGIDQDCDGTDPPCPVNDLASGAIDLAAGGTFTADLTFAHDDAPGPGSTVCGTGGGRDVFYTVHVATDEIWYLDTFGSDFDSVIRVYHNVTCTSLTGNTTSLCRNDACNTAQSQYVGTMSGDNCIVVRQQSSGQTHGNVVLHVERGNRKGTPINAGNSTITGNTCNGTNDASGTCGGGGPNINFYLTGCPAQTQTLAASTCSSTGAATDTSLFVRGAGGAEVACNDDDAGCSLNGAAARLTNVQLVGAHLFWVIVDTQTAAGCGPYSLTATIN